jgi:S1-C subfamily serine protease
MGRLFVARVSPGGPAERAGLKTGDIVLAIGGEEVATLADFYRRLWARGAAGTQVPLKVLQGMQIRDVHVRSIDRVEYFRPAKTY